MNVGGFFVSKTDHMHHLARGAPMKRIMLFILSLVPALLYSGTALAADEPTAADVKFIVDNLWVLLASFLVFIMNLGFATVETGLTRAKNTSNILFKNVMIPCIGIATYAAIGFSIMFPGATFAGSWFGFAGLGLNPPADGMTAAYGNYTYWTYFMYQTMFAATAATIISGAVAERIKFISFIIFSVLYLVCVYPVLGMWIWGGGWLAKLGFHDFAGSSVVHSIGGWGALAGIIILGPRIGKYIKGVSRPIPGHSMPLATIGVFILWFGWYGFNAGSVLSANPEAISLVCVNTSLGAAMGFITAMITSWLVQKKPDLSMALNGVLAGLVAITANCDVTTPLEASIIGSIGGILVVLSVLFIDGRLKLDDPVGATSVHLVNGIWGTIATGIFGEGMNLGIQLLGVAVVGVVSFSAALIFFSIIKALMGIRVSPEEELKGLDIGEHGMEAYSGFQIFVTQ
jgi:ammonium transporter, Amt family